MALVYFLLVLSVLVLIHEAGHYLVARLFGVKADEFGYGFPPRLIGFVKDRGKWKRVGRKDTGEYQNTIWSLNWLPLGGFVRIKGEQSAETDPDAFHMKPIWQRVLILAAGVVMNWLLAALLFSIVFGVGTQTVLEDLPVNAEVSDRSVQILQVLPDAPASEAGLRPNDVVREVAGKPVANADEARKAIGDQGVKKFSLVVERGTEQETLQITPRELPDVGRVAIGVALADVGTVSLPPLEAVKTGVLVTAGYTRLIVLGFGQILRDLFTLRGVSQDVSGPVGIAVMTGQIAQQGIVPLLQFAAILSVNLAVLNFLPIPALDGGRVLFLVIEKFRRRAMSRKIEAAIHNVAFLLLISLILLVTARDVSRYGSVIVNGLKGLVGM